MGAHHDRYVVTVGDDKFYLKYDVAVQAFNEQGDGPRSDDVTVYSSEGSMLFCGGRSVGLLFCLAG